MSSVQVSPLSTRERSRGALRRPVFVGVSAAMLAAVGLVPIATNANAAGSLLSQGKTTTASSAVNAAAGAVDGNLSGTRWESSWTDAQWLQVDLGAVSKIDQVVLTWEGAYGKAFQIQTSNDGTTWTNIYSTTTGAGGTQTLAVSGTGRYVRMNGTQRGTGYGYSLWEFQVFGSAGTVTGGGGATTCSTTNAALNHPASASSTPNGNTPAMAFDGNVGTRYESASTDAQWVQVDLGSTQTLCEVTLNWEGAYGKSFQLQSSNDGTTWTNLYSTTTGTGGTQVIPVSGSGRYVRMNGTLRGTPWGYSLWEFAVRTTTGGTGGTTPSPTPTPTPTTTITTSDTPDFGPNVAIFDPSTPLSTIQAKLDSVFAAQERNQFGTRRDALLFKPGSYNVQANIGFYTSIAGLGLNPDDTTIGTTAAGNKGDVTVDAGWFNGNATQNFWRSAENLAVIPSSGAERWAVAQAAPFRRIHVRGALDLYPASYGWASGGYVSDSKVDGRVESASQQQFYTRDSNIGSWSGSNWNMVFSGVNGAPAAVFPTPKAYTVLPTTPVSREKPYLYIDGAGKYRVFVPSLRTNASGASWLNGAQGTSLPMSQFFVAKPSDSTATINAALAQGLNLFFTPGVYHLTQAINVTRANTVVLGIGLPTLIPDNGVNGMTVADVDGVKLAGFLFDAGTTNSQVLLTVGTTGPGASHAGNPTTVQDVFFRIGGAGPGKATTSLLVNSNDVIVDHIWAWRADHGDAPTGWTINPADNGMIVNGNNVLATGLFVEHYQKAEVQWNGQNGKTIFFQNEMPYDVPNQASWMSTPTTKGYAAYKVANNVTSHEAWGLGSYCNFTTDTSVSGYHAYEVPVNANVKFHNMATVSLGGMGTITHIINDSGAAAQGSATVPVTQISFP